MSKLKIYLYLRLPKWIVQAHARFSDRHYQRMVKRAQKYFMRNPNVTKITIKYKGKQILFKQTSHYKPQRA